MILYTDNYQHDHNTRVIFVWVYTNLKWTLCLSYTYQTPIMHLSYTYHTPAKADDINWLIRTDNSMVRWICSVKLSDRKSSSELRSMLGLQDLESVFRFNRLRWYGHTQCMAEDNWPKKIINHDIGGKLCKWGKRKHWIHSTSARPCKVEESHTTGAWAWWCGLTLKPGEKRTLNRTVSKYTYHRQFSAHKNSHQFSWQKCKQKWNKLKYTKQISIMMLRQVI